MIQIQCHNPQQAHAAMMAHVWPVLKAQTTAGHRMVLSLIHHCREGQGMAQRAQNWLAIPLCPLCHTGPQGIHGDRRLLKARKLDEMDLLAMTIGALNT